MLEEKEKEDGKYFEIEKNIDCYQIDILIHPNIILEVNGPAHYYFNERQRKKTKYAVKEFTLQQKGYVYIDIPYFEYKQAFFTEKIKR